MMPKDPPFPPNATRVVEVLAYPSVKLLDVTGPIQVFATANSLMKQAGQAEPYVIRIVAESGQHVEASGGVELAVHALPSPSADLDTLVVAGGEGVSDASENSPIARMVTQTDRSCAPNGIRLYRRFPTCGIGLA